MPLTTIGFPCLIEADVPISTFGRFTFLGQKILRRYLKNRGFDTNEDIDHEGASHEMIPARNIVRNLSFMAKKRVPALTDGAIPTFDPCRTRTPDLLPPLRRLALTLINPHYHICV